MTTYEKHLSEPWFTLIKLGIKKVEGRLNKGEFSNMKKDDIITFINSDLGFDRKYNVKIIKSTNYNTFYLYLKNETLNKCLPGIDTIDDGLNVYYKYYTKADEETYKIKALTLKVIKDTHSKKIYTRNLRA